MDLVSAIESSLILTPSDVASLVNDRLEAQGSPFRAVGAEIVNEGNYEEREGIAVKVRLELK